MKTKAYSLVVNATLHTTGDIPNHRLHRRACGLKSGMLLGVGGSERFFCRLGMKE
jgi:hypothetical protein